MKRLLAAAVAAGVLTLAACGSASSAAPPPAAAPAHAAPAKPPPACKLTTTFNYLVRDADPGASTEASEIGNVDYTDCTDSLADFASTAGQADGECTTIALASSNPGYDAGAVPAAPLRDVIESAGPGC